MFAANIGVSDRPWSFNRNCLWNVPWSMDEKPRFSHSISSPTSNFVQAERKRSMQHMRRYRLKKLRSWGSVRRKYEDSLIPSGKLSKNYRTSPFWIGKSTIKGIFSIANCNKLPGTQTRETYQFRQGCIPVSSPSMVSSLLNDLIVARSTKDWQCDTPAEHGRNPPELVTGTKIRMVQFLVTWQNSNGPINLCLHTWSTILDQPVLEVNSLIHGHHGHGITGL